jgi:hypothetical protein
MRTLARILLITLVTGFIFSSCEKTPPEPVKTGEQQTVDITKTILTPEFRQALENAMTEYQAQNGTERNVGFIPAFFTNGVFGFFDDDMLKLTVFSTIPDEDDYLIMNTDGTVEVNIKSNDAVAEAFDYYTYASYYGEGAHMFMKYSGPVFPLPFPPPFQGFAFFVFPDDNTPASVWHGNGIVTPLMPGPDKNLVAHLVASKGWKNVKRTIKIN